MSQEVKKKSMIFPEWIIANQDQVLKVIAWWELLNNADLYIDW